VRELEASSDEIREKLRLKAEIFRAKADELFDVLSPMTGLAHTIPTGVEIKQGGETDSVDLDLTVTRTEGRTRVQFLWKTHNIHEIGRIPGGFALGSLNMTRAEARMVESQLPLLSIIVTHDDPGGSRRIFDEGEQRPESTIEFRINRSWLEKKAIASDGELDSSYSDIYRFLDFISDQGANPRYAMVLQLIAGINEHIADYLEQKRDIIEKMDF
jgi:hypothetical protein